MAEAGFPLAGDPKYGRNDANEYMREKFGINVPAAACVEDGGGEAAASS